MKNNPLFFIFKFITKVCDTFNKIFIKKRWILRDDTLLFCFKLSKIKITMMNNKFKNKSCNFIVSNLFCLILLEIFCQLKTYIAF